MKRSTATLVFFTTTFVACGDGGDPIAKGDIDALCTKVVNTMSDADMPECTEQMTEMKSQNEKLFMEIAKCTSEAAGKAALKDCNDQDNPRYKDLM